MKDLENIILALEEATIGVNEINEKLKELIKVSTKWVVAFLCPNRANGIKLCMRYRGGLHVKA